MHQQVQAPQVVGRRSATKRTGFTLVELLVVIVIIAVLGSIVTAAAFRAIDAAKRARIKLEIDGMATAMIAYKDKYGSYPPNFNDPTAVQIHFARAFPRLQETPPTGLSAAEALVFCLNGFSQDPTRPFTGAGNRTPIYDFEPTRLRVTRTLGGQNIYAYIPQEGQDTPFVYFDVSRLTSTSTTLVPSYAGAGSTTMPGTGTARPYRAEPSTTTTQPNPYANPKSFQIISAGLDGHFGSGATAGVFPTGTDYSPEDMDNLTNFATGTLEDSIP